MKIFLVIAIWCTGSISCQNADKMMTHKISRPAVPAQSGCPALSKKQSSGLTDKSHKYLTVAAENAFHQLQLAELALSNPETRNIGMLVKEDYKNILQDIKAVAVHLGIRLPHEISVGDKSSIEAIAREPNQKFSRIYDLLIKQNFVNMTMLYEAAYYNDADMTVLHLLEATVKKLAINHMVVLSRQQTASVPL